MSVSRSSACVREKDDGAENGAWGKAWSFMGQRAVNLDIGARGRLRYCTSNSAFPGGKLNPFQFYNPAVTSSYKYVQTTEQLIQGQWTHITVDHRASTNAAVSCQTCACCSRHTCVGKCTKVGKGQWCSNGWVGNQDPPAGIVTIRMQLGSAAVADSARTTVVLDLQRMHLFVDGSAQRGARKCKCGRMDEPTASDRRRRRAKRDRCRQPHRHHGVRGAGQRQLRRDERCGERRWCGSRSVCVAVERGELNEDLHLPLSLCVLAFSPLVDYQVEPPALAST